MSNSENITNPVRPELVEGLSKDAAKVHISNNFNSGSIKALYIKLFFNDQYLAHGTGFIGRRSHNNEHLLFTAKHIVTTIDFFTNKPKVVRPNKMEILYTDKNNSVLHKIHILDLYKAGGMASFDVDEKLWIEHPSIETDIVAFSLDNSFLNDISDGCFIDIEPPAARYPLEPGNSIYVLGFPFMRMNNFLAVWTSGSLAFEPSQDFPIVVKDASGKDIEKLLPVYLINARTFKGQSGSPVVDYPSNQARFNNNNDGCWNLDSGASGGILGIYTCRLNPPSEYIEESKQSTDLGIVWKTEVLQGFFTS
jgi:hypothetical protein